MTHDQEPLMPLPELQPEIEVAPDPRPMKTFNQPKPELRDFLDAETAMHLEIAQARLRYMGTICTTSDVIAKLIRAFAIKAEKRPSLYEQLK
jgi:hypothetical protein